MVDIANMVGVVNKLVGGKVFIMIQFDGDYLLVPVNPKDLEISQQASNSNLDILGIGKAVRKENPGLKSTKIKSFFPALNSNFNLMGVSPEQCIEFVKTIWASQYTGTADTLKIPRILTTGLDVNLNMYFVIDKFTYKYQHGTKDVEYTLQIKEYIPYGARRTDYVSSGTASARAPSVVNDDVPGINPDETNATVESKTYVIQSGDTLWSIAKRCTGDGNNWRDLYELNKEVIGSNPNSLRVGVTLTLPLGWSSPGARSSSGSGTKKLKDTKSSSILDDLGSTTAFDTAYINKTQNRTTKGGGSTVRHVDGKVRGGRTVDLAARELAQPTANIYDNLDVLDFVVPGKLAFKIGDMKATEDYISYQKNKMLESARAGDWEEAAKHKEQYNKWRSQYNTAYNGRYND